MIRVTPKRPWSLLFLLTLTLSASPAALLAQGSSVARLGEAYPDLVLPDVRTGEPIALSSFRGKKVLLIHFASW